MNRDVGREIMGAMERVQAMNEENQQEELERGRYDRGGRKTRGRTSPKTCQQEDGMQPRMTIPGAITIPIFILAACSNLSHKKQHSQLLQYPRSSYASLTNASCCLPTAASPLFCSGEKRKV